MTDAACPFCTPEAIRVFFRSPLVLGLWDAFPVSPGHALLAPTRHVANWFAATEAERAALLAGIDVAKREIEARHVPDGYNVGFNAGRAAGQTVFHLHLHVIPRYAGDVEDPRGGVRHVIPGRGNYLRPDRVADTEPRYAPRMPIVGEGVAAPPHDSALVTGEHDPLLPHLTAHLALAERADVAVAFLTENGLRLLVEHLRDLLDRKGRLRILTGDYLGFTDPGALRHLLDLSSDREEHVELRVFETTAAVATQRPGRTFHPKGYVLHGRGGSGVAFIGSSNLTESALQAGVEWNYRVVTSADPEGFSAVARAFENLFAHEATSALTDEWIDGYAARRPDPAKRPELPVDVDLEPPPPPPDPHEIQRKALAALEETRRDGNEAGLVVLATGLGKTWLSAFDSNQSDYRRILFVAHREEILSQSMETFRSIRPKARLGLYSGKQKDPNADVLFASIQTLSRKQHLEAFPPDHFDYVVIDEFHHASAASYRKLIDYARPKFLLGLTATPERSDGGDLLALCGENLVFRCDLTEGIRQDRLCPFRYFGVPDIVDYRNIPWRSTRFDEEALTAAVATRERARNALDQWRRLGGKRTLAFCVSQRHADFMAAYFREAGVRCVAVHSGPNSAPRTRSLEDLEAGRLDVVFAVDMFNEGVNLPDLDTVMMLRPTESKILWLQQFGRGLRKAEGKDHLRVIDYIGNHRIFLVKIRSLLDLGTGDASILRALQAARDGSLDLPPGCEVTYELEAIDMLKQLLRSRVQNEEILREYYEDFRERTGARPRAVEAFHDDQQLRSVRKTEGSWLRFVASMGDLSTEERQVLDNHGDFLDALEVTPMTKSYKMLVLEAMLRRDHFPGEITIEELTDEIDAIAHRSAKLRADFEAALTSRVELRSLVENNPIAAWTAGKGTGGTAYFAFDGNVFRTTFETSPTTRAALVEMTREIMEWRLAEYLTRGGDPPDEANRPAVPSALSPAPRELRLFETYTRQEIPPFFGLEFSDAVWNTGIITNAPGLLILLSTLRGGKDDRFPYENRFLAPDLFEWKSQRRTGKAGDLADRIRYHRERGIAVHLFVRPRGKTPKGTAESFVYCGAVDFVDWEGEKPITVTWRLRAAVPDGLKRRLQVP